MSTVAPLATASSTSAATRWAASALTSGPITVCRVGRVAVPGATATLAANFCGELLGERLVDEDPVAGHADLAGVHEDGEGGGVDRVVHVGVVQHDHGVLAAQLQYARA